MPARRDVSKLIMYRDPNYFGGKCAICRKRRRVFEHKYYPNLCDECRNSRVPSIHRKTEPVPFLSHDQIMEIAKDSGVTLDESANTQYVEPEWTPPQTVEEKQKLIALLPYMKANPRYREMCKACGVEPDSDAPVVQNLNNPLREPKQDLVSKALEMLK